MNQLTNESMIEGKTIERVIFVGYNEKPVIVFTDNTYVVFEFDHGRDHGDGNILVLTDELETDEQRDAGFISPEEYESIQKKESQKYQRQNEARERRQLEQLKKKYDAATGASIE